MSGGEFEKTVLRPGLGLHCPNALAAVVFDVTGRWYTPDGDDVVFDQRENLTMELDQADDELSQAIEDIICTMKPGEESEYLLYDTHRLLSNSPSIFLPSQPVPMGAEIAYKVHLHSFTQGIQPWKLTDQDRLEIAKKHKDQGSDLFKMGLFRGASIRYSKAVKYLAAVDPDTPFEVENLEDYEKEIMSIKAMALLNLAACQLKFGQHNNVINNCTRVLESDTNNIKAWFRRAKALLAMKDFEAARSDLMKAREIDPGNQAVNDLMKTMVLQETEHEAKYKDALKSMFN